MTTGPARRRVVIGRAAIVALAAAIWFFPVPAGLTAPAWHLFALFAATIVAVVADVIPILTASVIAVGLAVLTGTLPPAKAYSGFANGTLMISIRMSDEEASLSGVSRTQPGSSLGERMPAEPET